jgi:hypothetical protein
MFCPKCSRPITDDVLFCKQCGLALEGVRAIVGGGDFRESLDKARGAKARVHTPRQKGVRQGFKLVILALLILPFYSVVEGLFGSLIPSVENTRLDELPMELFGALLFIIFIIGLARMLYARLFESVAVSECQDDGEARLFGTSSRSALPPAQSIPAADYVAQRVSTADLAQPRSVTEHTTRSLRAD